MEKLSPQEGFYQWNWVKGATAPNLKRAWILNVYHCSTVAAEWLLITKEAPIPMWFHFSCFPITAASSIRANPKKSNVFVYFCVTLKILDARLILTTWPQHDLMLSCITQCCFCSTPGLFTLTFHRSPVKRTHFCNLETIMYFCAN